MGFKIYATSGTHTYLAANGVGSTSVRKHSEDGRNANDESAVEIITSGKVDLIINTPLGRGTRQDGWLIRTAAIQRSLPCITTIPGFKAAVAGIQSLRNDQLAVRSLQSWLS